ncbi:MAG: group I intron-associated PD-(D/E)XK endonuclease [Pseudomonadota bacterium]|nr:group I intron-associated PD-(D/E)XK endonuclease [Pseudomonadota bacterium]
MKDKNYSKEELLALKVLVKNGVSYPTISKVLKRSKSSVSNKASRLGYTNFRDHKSLNKNQSLLDYGKLDSKIKGTIAEYMVGIKLLEKNFEVYFPVANNQEEDIITSINNKFFRIQVKQASKTNDDRFRVSIVRKRSQGINKGTRVRYKNIDFFIIYIPIYNYFYVIPEAKSRNVKEFNFYPHKIKTMVRSDIEDWDFYKDKFDLIK